eukprot:TRINITY_DN35699_c0_g1_i1.p1 TRINITY_DN35699_c0_g1~~TRINITY_DN35699_c0_g1_i1.p1  ORF type:complete len:389 (+),score=73.06 TRINITY_DN35699_c0_g1_i1:47-1168(+)
MESPQLRSRSDASSGSGSEAALDEETETFCQEAPLSAHIGEALHRSFGKSLPEEVNALLSSSGARVSSSRLLKISFHATYLVDLDPPLCHKGDRFERAIVQVLGSQLGDKAICSVNPTSASTLQKAMEIAAMAGVSVPRVFATGSCNSLIGPLDFLIEEFIETQTVEDQVQAAEIDWQRIVHDVQSKLLKQSLAGVDVTPLPHFKSLSTHLQWLMSVVPRWDENLTSSLDRFAQRVLLYPPPDLEPVLVHQDLNGGNVLCSEVPAGQDRPTVHAMGVWSEENWILDAVIDWESAAVADPRSLSEEEPWSSVRAFSHLTKGSWLAEQFVRGSLPRCELHELIECYDDAATELAEKGLLSYETWAERVKRAKSAQ